MTKRASYRDAIRWIAHNDEPDDEDVESVAGYISTNLVADVWAKDPRTVAAAIVRERKLTR